MGCGVSSLAQVIPASENAHLLNEFRGSIIEKDETKIRLLIETHGSSLIQPINNEENEGSVLDTSMESLLISTFQKLIALESRPDGISGRSLSPSNNKNNDVLPEQTENVLSPQGLKPTAPDTTTSFDLHQAAKVGDTHEIIFLCLHSNNEEQNGLWQRDEFDNIPLYYACLNGHALSCAWLLLTMKRDMEEFERLLQPLEMERFIINSLNSDIKGLLKCKVDSKGKLLLLLYMIY